MTLVIDTIYGPSLSNKTSHAFLPKKIMYIQYYVLAINFTVKSVLPVVYYWPHDSMYYVYIILLIVIAYVMDQPKLIIK